MAAGWALAAATAYAAWEASQRDDQRSGTQTTTMQPAPRSVEGAGMMDAFMREYFGEAPITGYEQRPLPDKPGWVFREDYKQYKAGDPVPGELVTAFGVSVGGMSDPLTTGGAGTPMMWGTIPGGYEDLPIYGEPEGGLKGTLEDQGEYLRGQADKFLASLDDATTKYTGELDKIRGSKTEGGYGLLDPYKISFGGMGPVDFVPRRNIEQVGALSDIAANIYGVETDLASKTMQGTEQYGALAPGATSAETAAAQDYVKRQAKLAYLTNLQPLAMQFEGLRYGIPSSTQTGSLQLPGPHWTTQAANLMQLGSQGYDLYQSYNQPQYPSADPDLYGYGVGPGM